MNIKYIAIIICCIGVGFSSLSQYLLKLSAKKEYSKPIYNYLNLYVIIAYAIVFLLFIVNSFTLRYIPLHIYPIIESSAYIYVAMISYFLLKESISKKQLFGILLILLAIFIVSI